MNITEDQETVTLDNPDYYLTSDLTQRLDLISHLLANTDYIPYVQSSEGCGKTRLARHLADTLSDRYTVSLISGGPMAGISEMRAALAEIAGITASEDVSDKMLEQQFCQLADKKKNLLLLLDDADQLTAESLSWVVEFFCTRKSACNTRFVILSAVDVLALPLSPMQLSELRDNIQIMDIPKFTFSQMRGFVEFIRSDDLEPLSNAQIATLQKQTNGIPGKVLWQVQFSDLQQNEPELTEAKQEPWLKPFLLLAILGFLVSVGLIFYFQDEINQFVASDSPNESDSTGELQTLVIPPQEEIPMVVTDMQDVEAEAKPGPDSGPVAEVETSHPDPDSGSLAVKKAAVATTSELVVEAEQDAEPEQDNEQQSLTAAPQVSDKPEPAPETTVLVSRTTRQVEKTMPPAVPPAVPEATPAMPPDSVVAVAAPGFKSTDWLYAQGDKAYTLQLLAVSERAGINRFMKKHNLQGDIVILESIRNGKTWYSLLYGAFSSRAAAVKASKQLPKGYKSSSAWPRSVQSVKTSQQAN